MRNLSKKELGRTDQFVVEVVASKGVTESKEWCVYTKEEMLARLDEVLPEGYGFSLIAGEVPKKKVR